MECINTRVCGCCVVAASEDETLRRLWRLHPHPRPSLPLDRYLADPLAAAAAAAAAACIPADAYTGGNTRRSDKGGATAAAAARGTAAAALGCMCSVMNEYFCVAGSCVGEKSRPHFMLYLLLQMLEAGVYTVQALRLLMLPVDTKSEW